MPANTCRSRVHQRFRLSAPGRIGADVDLVAFFRQASPCRGRILVHADWPVPAETVEKALIGIELRPGRRAPEDRPAADRAKAYLDEENRHIAGTGRAAEDLGLAVPGRTPASGRKGHGRRSRRSLTAAGLVRRQSSPAA